jgi:LuxR family maltose regulon positive regulatory protein
MVRAQQRELTDSLYWAHYYLGRVAYVENRLDDAWRHLEEVVAHRYAARFTPALDGHLCLTLVYQARLMPEEARRVVDEVATFVRALGEPDPVAEIESLQAHLALLQGRTDAAVAWAEGVSRQTFYSPNAWSQIVPFTLVRVLLAEGSAESLADAAQMLSAMQQTAATGGSLLHLTQLLALQAVLHDQLGEHEAALAALDEALTLAQPSRAIRLFADLGIESTRRLSALLRQLDETSQTHGFARLVLAALSASPLASPQLLLASSAPAEQPIPPTLPPQELIEPLTPRELEILALIEQGMSNKQIAQRLVISDKTVENHTTNIYQKLDVRNRTQAVRRATELRLLPPL